MRIVIAILLAILAYHAIRLWSTKRRLRATSLYLPNPRDRQR
jgi:hypothetical protein